VAETASGGPFYEITTADFIVNSIYLSSPILLFVMLDSFAKPERELRVACDVSCNPNNPHNPVPLYRKYSIFIQLMLQVEVAGDGPPLTMVSIDHPSNLLPHEASKVFLGKQLMMPRPCTVDTMTTCGSVQRNSIGQSCRSCWLRAKAESDAP
jgi:saccharopine dehydrogenase (NAD+, L-lysine-forming)